MYKMNPVFNYVKDKGPIRLYKALKSKQCFKAIPCKGSQLSAAQQAPF